MPKKRHVPERSCVSCARKAPKQELVRLVRTPQHVVTVDSTGKAAGRGAYLCWSGECWDRALDRGSLSRSLGVRLSHDDLGRIRSVFEQAIAQNEQVD
jgi:predicted RNA-binding protein YlxR (DUF448 family)